MDFDLDYAKLAEAFFGAFFGAAMAFVFSFVLQQRVLSRQEKFQKKLLDDQQEFLSKLEEKRLQQERQIQGQNRLHTTMLKSQQQEFESKQREGGGK